MIDHLKRILHVLNSDRKRIFILFLYGLFSYIASFLIEFVFRYLSDASSLPQAACDMISYLLVFVRYFIWYLLFAGAVYYSSKLYDREEVQAAAFISVFKKDGLLKTISLYAFFLSLISAIPFVFNDLVTKYTESVGLHPYQYALQLLSFLFSCVQIYLLYRMIFVPFLFGAKDSFHRCLLISFQLTKKFRVVVKWWLLVDVFPYIIAFILLIVFNLGISDDLDLPVLFACSQFELDQLVLKVILSIFLPFKLIGYQICMHDINNRIG